MNRTPVILIAGFLGAGKTTLLVQLLEAAKARGVRTAVLMNEAGAISIDGPVAQSVGANIEVMNVLGGCICCTLKGELHAALKEIVADVRPELLFIETTGIADPVEVIDTGTALDLLDAMDVRGVVSVLDVEFGHQALRINDLARRQLELAAVILLNKMDLADPAWFPRLQEHVRAIAPAARLLNTVQCNVDATSLLDELLVQGHAEQTGEPGLDTMLKEIGPQHGQKHEHAHEHAHSFVALSFRVGDASDKHTLLQALQALPPNVIRAKGFLRVGAERTLHICQFANGHAQAHIFPLEGFSPEPTIVVIGRELNRGEIERALLVLRPVALN